MWLVRLRGVGDGVVRVSGLMCGFDHGRGLVQRWQGARVMGQGQRSQGKWARG